MLRLTSERSFMYEVVIRRMARKPTGPDRPPDLLPSTAIQLLRKQLERAADIVALNYSDPQIAAWESTTEAILARAFGSPGGELHKNTQDFGNARGQIMWNDVPDVFLQQNHVASTERQRALLEAFIRAAPDRRSNAAPSKPISDLRKAAVYERPNPQDIRAVSPCGKAITRSLR